MKRNLLIFLFAIGYLMFLALASAIDFTPQGDINLRGVYAIENGTNFSAQYYCNATGNNCYSIGELSSDTTYTAGSNLTLTGTIFSVNMTSVKNFFDTIYQAIGNYLTTATNFGGEVSGNASNIVLDNDALDDQYVELTDLPLANETKPYCGNVTGSDFDLCTNPDTNVGNDGITLQLVNITGVDDNACTGNDKVSNVTFNEGVLTITCTSDISGGSPAANSINIVYQNVTNWPTCAGNDKLTHNGTDIICETDQTAAGGDPKSAGNQPLYNNSVSIFFNDTFNNITTDQRIALNPESFLTSVSDDSIIIKYQNISNLPTCGGTDKLTFDGTTLSCGSDIDTDTQKTTGGQPLYNTTDTIFFNSSFNNGTIDGRISLNPEGFLTSVSDDSVVIKYQNISNIPTCTGSDKLAFDGTTLSCETDTDTTYTNGSGISLVGAEFNHSDTSSQSSSDNSGNSFIQDIVLDVYGHIASLVVAVVDFSGIYTAIDGNITALNGTYLNLPGDNADQNMDIGNYNFSSDYVFGKTTTPSGTEDLVNKDYVDFATASTAFDFFFNNFTSDVVGSYNMTEMDLDLPESELLTASLGVGTFSVFNWTTQIGQPEFNELRQGIYDVHIHLSHTGSRSVTITPKLYNISSDGSVSNLLITFETSGELTGVGAEYELHGVLSDPIMIPDGDRLLLELVAVVSGGGSNVVISAFQEGTTDSHLTVETSSNAFEAIFIRKDGSFPLTGNWDQGVFNFTNPNSWFLGKINYSNVQNHPADDDTTYTAGANLSLVGTIFSLNATSTLNWLNTIFESLLVNEAGLYAALSDVTEFIETNDAATLTTLDTGQGANELYEMDQNVSVASSVAFTQFNASDHFKINSVNITCFDSACAWFMNATDSCTYWPSGGKDCGAA